MANPVTATATRAHANQRCDGARAHGMAPTYHGIRSSRHRKLETRAHRIAGPVDAAQLAPAARHATRLEDAGIEEGAQDVARRLVADREPLRCPVHSAPRLPSGE